MNEYRYTRRGAVRVPTHHRDIRFIVALMLACFAAVCIALYCGHARTEKMHAVNAAMRARCVRVQADNEMLESEIDGLNQSLLELEDENETLKADLDQFVPSVVDTITPQSMRDELIDLDTVRLSSKQVTDMLSKWCDRYGITGANRKWLIATGVNVAWHESRYDPKCINRSSGAAGLYQFLPGWGSLTNRLDPDWSTRRFVKCFKEGGKAAIRKHWAQTVTL